MPGDALPGGGHFVNAAGQVGNWSINAAGDVAFSARIDEDADKDGFLDTGLYLWSGGELHLVARSGTPVPGIGVIAALMTPLDYINRAAFVFSGAILNNNGEVFFTVTMRDNSYYLFVAAR
jgi:hypothetical protein